MTDDALPADVGRLDDRWLQRRRQEHLDEAAERLRDRLARDPDSIASSRTSLRPVLLSGLVLGAGGGAVGLLAWWTAGIDVWWGWILATLGWAAVWELLPRPSRLRDEAVVLQESAYPSLHRVVRRLSEDGGFTRPDAIAVDTSFSTTVVRIGWRGTRTLRIGLPLWTAQSSDDRLGSLARALADGHEDHTVRARLTAASGALLDRLWRLVEPQPAGAASRSRMVQQLRRVAVAPVAALLDLAAMLGSEDALQRQYLADQRAALAVGTPAVVASIAEPVEGLSTTAGSASRRGEDPFEHLAKVSARGITAQRARADDATQGERVRLALLRKDWVPFGHAVPDLATQQAAEAELATLRPRLRRQLQHDLNDARLMVRGTQSHRDAGRPGGRPDSGAGSMQVPGDLGGGS